MEVQYGRKIIIRAVQELLARRRSNILQSGSKETVKVDEISKVSCTEIQDEIKLMLSPSLKRVINATGVIVHTNIGRAPLSETAVKAVSQAAKYYSNLELDILSGKRGKRYAHVKNLLQELTGAESGIVVNNNAAAVLLCLSTLAKGNEVIISRGELIEIGGSFRIPEIMEQSGTRLIEVGSTNRTHIEDYKKAINKNTKMILKVHTSNYRVVGFTSEVSLNELHKLSKEYDLPLLYDMGSGNFIPAQKIGLQDEPTVQDEVLTGADIITFSGDKLLGGPQAGIIVGKKKYVDQLSKNPLNRALRIDKLTLAALEATLKVYSLCDDQAGQIPVVKMLEMSLEELKKRAGYVVQTIKSRVDEVNISIIEDASQVGGGANPVHNIPAFAVSLDVSPVSVNAFEQKLRELSIPVIARIKSNKILFNMRTLLENEVKLLPELILSVIHNS